MHTISVDNTVSSFAARPLPASWDFEVKYNTAVGMGSEGCHHGDVVQNYATLISGMTFVLFRGLFRGGFFCGWPLSK